MSGLLAHAGHWIANFLYAAPVLVLVGALVIQRLRDRRDGPRPEHEDSYDDDDERDAVLGSSPRS